MIHDIGAKEISLIDREVYDSQRLDIYIGVFFDGTNNNKVQSMIGQYFRRKEVFEKNKKAFEKLKGKVKDGDTVNEITKEVEITDFDSFIKSGITKDVCKNILGFTDSDCDKIFGTSTAITNNFEKKIMEVDNSDNGANSYRWSSAAIGYSEGWNDLLDNPVNNSDVIVSSLCKNIPIFPIQIIGHFEDYKNKYSHALYWGNKMLKHQIRKRLEYISGIKSKNESYIPEWTIKGAGAQNATYTNPAILDNLYKTGVNEEKMQQHYYSIYVEGSGADNIIFRTGKIGGFFSLTLNTDLIGLASGVGKTGVCSKCRKAVEKINDIVNKYNGIDINLHFDVFGFSRGATTSRIFTYLVNPNKDNYNIPNSDYILFTGNEKPFLINANIKSKEVRLLGLYDTVSSIGVINKAVNKIAGILIPLLFERESLTDYRSKRYYHEYNVKDYSLWRTTNAKNVVHFCALDEYRKNFALVDIESSINNNGIEIFMPGCHTDIGGGAGLGLDDLKIINKEYLRIKSFNEFYNEIYQIIENTIIGSYELLKEYIICIGDFTMYEANSVAIAIGDLIKELGNKLSEYGYNLSGLVKEIIEGSQIDKVVNNLKNEVLVEVANLLEKGFEKIDNVIINLANKTKNLDETINSHGNDVIETREQLKNIQFGNSQTKECDEFITDNHKKLASNTMKFLTWKKVYFSRNYPCEKIDAKFLEKIDAESLEKHGWISRKANYKSDKEKSNFIGRAKNCIIKEGKTIVVDGTKVVGLFQRNNIGIYKYVTPGYSNVTLALMRDWALNKSSNYHLFDPIPIDFLIPDDLESFYDKIKKTYLNIPGRYYCVPTHEQYKKLRCKYLHFSMNERFLDIADNNFVNGPEIDKYGIITRRIYPGVQNEPNNDKKYMYNYTDKVNTIKNVDIKIDENEFFYLYSSKYKKEKDYEKGGLIIINSSQSPSQQKISRHKNQIRPGMFNINPSDHAYIDENSNFHISKTENYTEYPKNIDQIHPGMFKLPSEDKNNK